MNIKAGLAGRGKSRPGASCLRVRPLGLLQLHVFAFTGRCCLASAAAHQRSLPPKPWIHNSSTHLSVPLGCHC